jgi:hypothetical protein
MFPRLACALIATALLGAGAAQAQQLQTPAGFRESFRLEVPASFVAGRPVQVWCARNDSVWRAAKRAADGHGYALTQAGISFYPDGTCTTLEAWRASSRVTSLFGLDLLVLIHESFHAGGLTDEEGTQCQAKKKLAEVAIRFFGFKPRSPEIRKLVRLAYVRSHGIPSAC